MKILICDDHEMIRDGIRYMLESYGFEIDEASGGLECVEKTLNSNSKYDVLIVDYQMPDIDGLEVTKRILAKKPDAKILILSNYDEYSYVESIIRSGAKGYVLKNIGPNEMIPALNLVKEGKNYYSSEISKKLIQFGQAMSAKKNLSFKDKEIIAIITRYFCTK